MSRVKSTLPLGSWAVKWCAYSIQKSKRVKLNTDHLVGLNQPQLLGLDADGDSAYVFANVNGSNTRGVYRLNVADAQVMESVWQHPNYDVATAWRHPVTKRMIYAGYREDGKQLTWFDKTLEQTFTEVLAALGGPKQFEIEAFTPDLSHVVISVVGNGVKPAHYRLRLADKSLIKLGEAKFDLGAEFEFVTYKARDGLVIPAYLALPGPRSEGPYPTIIDPHGGTVGA